MNKQYIQERDESAEGKGYIKGTSVLKIHFECGYDAGYEKATARAEEKAKDLIDSIKDIIKNKPVHENEYHHYDRSYIIGLLEQALKQYEESK